MTNTNYINKFAPNPSKDDDKVKEVDSSFSSDDSYDENLDQIIHRNSEHYKEVKENAEDYTIVSWNKEEEEDVFLDDYKTMLNGTKEKNKVKGKCLIDGSSGCKIMWDIGISFLLVIICCVIPVDIAFIDSEFLSGLWWFLLGADILFIIDMILCFFTTT
jgi:hypothetical protein